MKKTLCALIKKVQWQLNDLNQEQGLIEQEIALLAKKITDNQQKIDEASNISAFILPEQEIARLNFILRQQQDQEVIKANKMALISQQTSLASRKKRLVIELTLLEKHQHNQSILQKKESNRIQQNNADEWALQSRDHA